MVPTHLKTMLIRGKLFNHSFSQTGAGEKWTIETVCWWLPAYFGGKFQAVYVDLAAQKPISQASIGASTFQGMELEPGPNCWRWTLELSWIIHICMDDLQKTPENAWQSWFLGHHGPAIFRCFHARTSSRRSVGWASHSTTFGKVSDQIDYIQLEVIW